MTQRISLDEVRRVANLARLRLPDDELARMQAELASILDSMAALERLDVTGVAPTYHALEAATPLREDVPREGLRRDEALRAAPRTDAHAFAVPKVMEGD